MKEANAQSGEKKRTRRLVFAAAGMFAIALCVFGSLFYLQSRAQDQGRERRVGEHFGKSYSIPDISAEEKQKIVARAMVLRDKWRPWALAHRAELKRMLSAKATDSNALNVVWNELPVNPGTATSLTFKELVPTGNPLVGIGFGWAPIAKAYKSLKATTPDAKKDAQQITSRQGQQQEDDFQELRDVVIATSSAGLIWTSLWASGRITQRVDRRLEDRDKIAQNARAEGRKVRQSDLLTPHKEVVPPFDFLTSQNSSIQPFQEEQL